MSFYACRVGDDLDAPAICGSNVVMGDGMVATDLETDIFRVPGSELERLAVVPAETVRVLSSAARALVGGDRMWLPPFTANNNHRKIVDISM